MAAGSKVELMGRDLGRPGDQGAAEAITMAVEIRPAVPLCRPPALPVVLVMGAGMVKLVVACRVTPVVAVAVPAPPVAGPGRALLMSGLVGPGMAESGFSFRSSRRWAWAAGLRRAAADPFMTMESTTTTAGEAVAGTAAAGTPVLRRRRARPIRAVVVAVDDMWALVVGVDRVWWRSTSPRA